MKPHGQLDVIRKKKSRGRPIALIGTDVPDQNTSVHETGEAPKKLMANYSEAPDGSHFNSNSPMLFFFKLDSNE